MFLFIWEGAETFLKGVENRNVVVAGAVARLAVREVVECGLVAQTAGKPAMVMGPLVPHTIHFSKLLPRARVRFLR